MDWGMEVTWLYACTCMHADVLLQVVAVADFFCTKFGARYLSCALCISNLQAQLLG